MPKIHNSSSPDHSFNFLVPSAEDNSDIDISFNILSPSVFSKDSSFLYLGDFVLVFYI